MGRIHWDVTITDSKSVKPTKRSFTKETFTHQLISYLKSSEKILNVKTWKLKLSGAGGGLEIFHAIYSVSKPLLFSYKIDGAEHCEETLSLGRCLWSQVNYLLGILCMLLSPLDYHGMYPKEYSL